MGRRGWGDTGPPRAHRPLQDVSMAARQVARQWEGAEDLTWARLVAGQEIPRRQRCWVQGNVTPKLPTCPLPTPAHPAPHLHMVPAAPAGVWQGDRDVAALLGGFLCGLQGGGTVRPRPRLGCAPGAPSWGEGLQVRLQEERPSSGLHPQDRIRRPGHRGSRDRRMCPAAAPPWLRLTPYLDLPCPHVHIIQSSNPLCNHEINKAERGPGECGGGEDRGLGDPVSCKSNCMPATCSHIPTAHQPHASHTPATQPPHARHLQLHTSFTSAQTGKEVTCSKPSLSAWPSRMERVL